MFGNRGFEVYVGDLDSSVTEQLLYNSFARFGMISSVKIMRHIVTHQSRGFGFVTFHHQSEGERAISEMHKTKLLNQKIKVYSKIKFNSFDRNSNLLLLNLPLNFDIKDIEKMTVNYGGVFSMRVASQEAEKDEFRDHTINTRRRAYLQFEKISDALRFKKEFHGSKIEDQEIVIVFTHLHHVISVKGPISEGIQEKVLESLQKYGKCNLLDFKSMKNKPDFIATIEFEDPENAREVYLTFRSTKSKFPFTSCLEPVQGRKRNPNINYKKIKKFYCKIYFDKTRDITEMNQKLKENYPDFESGTISEEKQGKFIYEILFGNSKALAKFIFELENNKSCLKDDLSGKKPEIEYPRFLIKTLKMNKWNRVSQRFKNPSQMQGGPMQMQRMGQYGGGNMNPMQMQMRMRMQMQMQMQMMMQAQMGMGNQHMGMNMGMVNQQMGVNPMQVQPEISGLEVILQDLEGFKSKGKEEQNKLLMEVLRKKMITLQDKRANNEEFMKMVGDFFLDNSVLDIDERLSILADNKRIVEFLSELVKE